MADYKVDEPSTRELDLLRDWLQKYERSKSYYNKFFEEGKENYYLYKSYITSDQDLYTHDIFVPYTFAFIEDVTAYFMLSVLSSEYLYTMEPRGTRVTRELCRDLENILQWMLGDDMAEFVLELEELIKNMSIYGVAYLMNYPIVGDKLMLNRDEYVSVPTMSRMHFDAPHSLTVYPEPHVKRLSRMNWLVKRSLEPWGNLKSLYEDGVYNSKVLELRDKSTYEETVTNELLQAIGYGGSDITYGEKEGRIEILDCMTGGGVLTIANKRRIIQNTLDDEIQPFLFDFPILDCRAEGAPGEFFGVSKAGSMGPLQRDLNMLRSQRRENVSLILNKMWKYDMLAGTVDLDTLISAPNNVILTHNNDALEEVIFTDITASSYKEEEALIHDMQSVTSLWDYARGGTPQRKETATGIMRLQQAAQARNEWTLRKLDAYVLMPLAKRMIVYAREYLDKSDYDNIVGTPNAAEEFYSLEPRDLVRQLQIRPMTESITNVKEINMNQFLQAFDRLIQIPDVNRPALIKQMLERLGQKDLKSVLPMMSPPGQSGVVTGQEEAAQLQAQLPFIEKASGAPGQGGEMAGG